MKTADDIINIVTNPSWIEPTASEHFNIWSNLEFIDIYTEDDHPAYDYIVAQAVGRLKDLGICVEDDPYLS
jgi:hypothetical protein